MAKLWQLSVEQTGVNIDIDAAAVQRLIVIDVR